MSGEEGAGPDAEDDAGAPRTWSDEEENALRVWIALARCYSTFARAVAAKIAGYDDLTPAQFGILEALHHVGPLALGDLADKLLMTGGNVTYVMDRLEERDLVRRERWEEDRRVVLARLTPAGRRLMVRVFPEHARYIRELVDVLEPDEEDEIRRLLKKLGKGVADPPG